ncbi:MAG: hypothetical protein NTW96_09620 [Planctomycetia bacterium]|nr:hypothetical protein [Planctomycetia bacterium]
MTKRFGARWARGTLIVAVVGILSIGSLAARPTHAQDATAAKTLDKGGTSLRWIPDSAAIYSTSLRNREKFEAIAKSKAWAKLRELPAVKMAWQMYETQAASPESGPGKVQAALEDPQVQDLMDLLADMVSDEIFVYGDADMVDFFGLLQEVGGAMRYGPALVELSGRKKDLSKDDVQAMILLGALSHNVDAVKVPGMVLGFKLEDKSRAVLNLGKLELIAGFALKQNPRFAECLKRTKIGGSEYLVLTLKGGMVPWDQLPLERFRRLETEPGSVDKLVAKLKKESLVVAVGLREDYLLLAVGSSTDILARLGQGTSLAERPEMAPLAKFADKRIASIGYVSKALAQVASGNEQNIDDLLEFAEQAIPRAGLTDEQQAQIRKDALALAADIKQILPAPGAMMSVAFLTDRGVEGYTYDWGTQPGLVAGQPLGLLEHVGGSPILAVVSRSKVSIDGYDGLTKWLGVGYGYFEKYGLPQMKESDRENFKRVAELVGPVLKRLNDTNRDLFLPALDGQGGLVIDAKLKSKQFIKTLPETDEAMPMAEPAIVLGVKDPDLMRRALVEYWAIAHAALGVAVKIDPKAADVQLPEPETVDTDNGQMFVFTPPDACPVDKQIAPNVGLGKTVCVLSMSKDHTERLLKATPLKVGGVLAKTDRPLAMAACFDWEGLVGAARPWVAMATDRILEDKMGAEQVKAQAPAIKSQVNTVLDVLSVLRHITSETYEEDGVMVTHTLTEIRDLD